LAYDGSQHAMTALERAAQFATRAATDVAVVMVVDPLFDVTEQPPELREAVENLRSLGISARVIVADGDPAGEIIRTATADQSDLIVIGSRGLGGTARLLMGSVSSRVAQHAPCDVYIAH
jgi:nucleotide-binding universal stress UspA family protein